MIFKEKKIPKHLIIHDDFQLYRKSPSGLLKKLLAMGLLLCLLALAYLNFVV